MAIDLEKHINFNGSEWHSLREWLAEQDSNKVSMMLGATTEKETNELRGAIKFIRQLLAIESSARLRSADNTRTYDR